MKVSPDFAYVKLKYKVLEYLREVKYLYIFIFATACKHFAFQKSVQFE